ncbi:MAG: Gfo/Idh/MocA family oxidoreductase [Akkermansiaceae bacterium]|nr:Gfo/Idh/MocA family oxidoreductase [Akkermansiaceae bacterium]
MNTNRRKFIAGAAAFAGMPAIIPSSALGKDGHVAPSNRIVVGGIGLGPRGRKVLECFHKQDDVQFVAICDVQAERAEIVRRLTNRCYGNEDCKTYRKMEDLLARDDIDAVLIATGDRWHTPATVQVARAGKDIYCEKPCSMTIAESRELDEAVTQHGRVFQAGTQRRNVDNFRFAAQLAQSGKLGKITSVHAGSIKPALGMKPLPGQPLPDPEVIDWDRWLGPSPEIPYNRAYCRGRWRGYDELSAGWKVLEWGAHTIDICQWGAGKDDTSPVEFEPDGSTIYGKYADGTRLEIRIAGFKGEGNWQEGLSSCPVRLEGEDGWIEAGDSGKVVCSDKKLFGLKRPAEMHGIDPIKHVREFVDCVKSRKKTACNSRITRNGHVAGHAASIAWRLGRKLTFDPKTERFLDDEEANDYCVRERRAAYDV